MRKFILITAAVLFLPKSVFPQKKPAGTNWAFETYTSVSSCIEQPSLRYDAGTSISAGCLKITAGTGTDKINLNKAGDFSPQDIASFHKVRYGARINKNVNFLPLNIDLLAGTLSFSGTVSRLKNPVPSVPSALCRPITLTPGINPSLPSFTSAQKPFSAAISLAPSDKHSLMPRLQAAYIPDCEFILAADKSFSAGPFPKISLSVTAASLKYGTGASSSWFLSKKAFPQKNYAVLGAEANFMAPAFRSSTAFGIYENPFGGVLPWVRTHNFLVLGDFMLGTSYFVSDPQTITSSGTVPSTKESISITPQYTFRLEKSAVAAGLTAHAARKRQSGKSGTEYAFFCTKAALSYKTRGLSSTLSQSTEISLENEEPALKNSVQCSVKKTFGSLYSGTSVSFAKKTSSSKLSASQSLSPKNSVLQRSTADFSITLAEEPEFECGISASFGSKSKNFRWTAKIALDYTVQLE